MFLWYNSVHIICLSLHRFLLFFTIFSLHYLSSFTRAFSVKATRKLPTNLPVIGIIDCGRSDMLIRIRNNVGTWKLNLDIDNGDENSQGWIVKDILADDVFEQYKLVEPLSFDPSGTKPLSKTKTLLEQGLSHGSMIFCRVKERDLLADDDSYSSVAVCSPQLEDTRTRPLESLASNPSESFKEPQIARKATPALPPKETVIEILCSDDDDDMDKSRQATPNLSPNEKVIEIQSSDDDDDMDKSKGKQSPVPKKRVASKRASSPVDGTSGSTSAKKARANPTTQSSASRKQSSAFIDFKIASYNIW